MTPIENCKLLRAAVAAEPGHKLNLDVYQSHCGTLHCMAGLATTMPEFQAQGLGFEAHPSFALGGQLTLDGTPIVLHELQPFFGGSAYLLFDMYGLGYERFCEDFPACYAWDGSVLGEQYNILTHKELALLRLDYHIAKLELAETTEARP